MQGDHRGGVVEHTIEQTKWRDLEAVSLASDAVSIQIVPALGGRVVSLIDRRTGREWLMQAQPGATNGAADWASEDMEFGGLQSFGWDECLPTVAVCADPVRPEGDPLRDHGEQWGRRSDAAADGLAIVSTWPSSRWPYRMTRRLSIAEDDAVLAEYAVESEADEPLPMLWSMHPTLPVEPGSRIELPGVDTARLTWAGGIELGQTDTTPWPIAQTADGESIDLSQTRSGAGWAAKLYVSASDPVTLIRPDGARLEWDWDRSFAPTVGIWLSSGGWPPSGPAVEQIAIEPTTSPDDDLAGALDGNRAQMLEPGGRLDWWVRLTLTP
jgi:galactose mutarotase-like enzyme